jgi:hypothetical protein
MRLGVSVMRFSGREALPTRKLDACRYPPSAIAKYEFPPLGRG